MAKESTFALRLTEREKRALTKLAIAESSRLQEEVNRPEWIRRKIREAAKRKGFWK